jgi:hypothetical protein
MKSILLLLVVGLATTSCGPKCPTKLGDSQAEECWCEAACKTLETLGCKDPDGNLLASPLADGTSCPKFCVRKMRDNIDMHPKCVAEAETCKGVNGCFGGL